MVFERVASSTLPSENRSLLGKSSKPLSSPLKTFANVFIAIVGAGVLGLPYTFKRTGWVLGSVMLISVAVVTYHCMMLLVHTRRKLELQHDQINSLGDLGFAVCGPIGRFSVDLMILLAHAGFCVSYLIFIGNTMGNIFKNEINIPKALYIWGCFPFQLGLNSIPTLTHLAPLSIFADAVDLGAMGAVMVEDWGVLLRNRPALQAYGGVETLLYGVGVAVYAFEGVGMILPLESEARDKERFGAVLGGCMGFIAVLYGAFGVLGYSAFGEETRDIVTSNLGAGAGAVSALVQVGLCVNLFFTFPLMMNPVYEVAERRVCGGAHCLLLRWGGVLGVTMLSLFVPNFADFLSLVGSTVCSALGFVLPALFHLLIFRDDMPCHALAVDGLIVVLGLIVAVSGTYSSLMYILAPKA